LVKTAIFGHDCNWGRIAVALGTSGAAFDVHDVAIDIMGIPVCRGGMAMSFDEDEALRRFESDEIVIDADLGAGDASCTIWTCDLTYDYVRINGDYRT
jgi:glutamate N-acetyltransferase/amino-acid N-acetyltransferase